MTLKIYTLPEGQIGKEDEMGFIFWFFGICFLAFFAKDFFYFFKTIEKLSSAEKNLKEIKGVFIRSNLLLFFYLLCFFLPRELSDRLKLEPDLKKIYVLEWENGSNFLLKEKEDDPKKAPLLLSKEEWKLPPNIKVGELIEFLNLNGEEKFFAIEFNGGKKIVEIPIEVEVEEKK